MTSCGPLSVPILDHLSQTLTDTHKLPHETLLHREEDTSIPCLLTGSGTVSDALPQTCLDEDKTLTTSQLFTESPETERESVQSQPKNQGVIDEPPPDLGPSTSPFMAEMIMQEPILPVGSCQSVGEDTSGMASSTGNNITDKQRGDNSTVCQDPSNQGK